MDYAEINGAACVLKQMYDVLPLTEVGRHSASYISVYKALQFAGKAQRALVALRDYFTDESVPHKETWLKELVLLVGNDTPAPTLEEVSAWEKRQPPAAGEKGE